MKVGIPHFLDKLNAHPRALHLFDCSFYGEPHIPTKPFHEEFKIWDPGSGIVIWWDYNQYWVKLHLTVPDAWHLHNRCSLCKFTPTTDVTCCHGISKNDALSAPFRQPHLRLINLPATPMMPLIAPPLLAPTVETAIAPSICLCNLLAVLETPRMLVCPETTYHLAQIYLLECPPTLWVIWPLAMHGPTMDVMCPWPLYRLYVSGE